MDEKDSLPFLINRISTLEKNHFDLREEHKDLYHDVNSIKQSVSNTTQSQLRMEGYIENIQNGLFGNEKFKSEGLIGEVKQNTSKIGELEQTVKNIQIEKKVETAVLTAKKAGAYSAVGTASFGFWELVKYIFTHYFHF